MGLIVDIILVSIIVLSVFIGYKKGLIKVAFSIFAFVVALIATLVLVKPVSYLIVKNTQIDENIKAFIVKNNMVNNNEQTEDKDQDDTYNSDNKNNYIQQYVENRITDTTEEAKSKVLDATAETISKKLIEFLTAIIIFIIIRVILIVLRFLSDKISKIPLIKQCNEVGGIIYGLIKALLIIYLALTIIFIVTSIRGSDVISDAIQESYVTKYLYNNNIVVNYCLFNKNML